MDQAGSRCGFIWSDACLHPHHPPPPFQLDFFTWSHPDFLSIFAAGNNAGNGSASSGKATVGPFDGFGLLPGGTVQSPANAKNVIAVGSVFNYVPPGPGAPLKATFTATSRATGKQLHPHGFHAPFYFFPAVTSPQSEGMQGSIL